MIASHSLLRTSLIVFVTVSLATADSSAQNTYSDQVYMQLRSLYLQVKPEAPGLRCEKTVISHVRDDDSDTWTFYFEQGRRYFVVGACDSDCRDLDLQVIDASSGTTLARDLLLDDTPMVNFTPERSGRYKVRARMANCQSSRCYLGFSILSHRR